MFSEVISLIGLSKASTSSLVKVISSTVSETSSDSCYSVFDES